MTSEAVTGAATDVGMLVARARAAQRQYEGWSQAQVDLAVLAAGWAIIEPARNRELAELAVADTGIGNVEDKVRKNHRKTFGLLRDLRGAPSVGVIAEDPARGIVEIARPVGVVCAITPSTNPGATPANKIINALKGRNAVVVAPSPKGWTTCARLVGFIHAELERIGMPSALARDLVQVLPSPVTRQATAELMDYSERRLRAEIRELPDGEYSASMLVEDDGVTADPFEIKVTIVIDGDEIIADFTGTSPQVRGPMNCTVVVVASAIYNAVFSITDPHTTIPRNSGCYRPVKFIAPAGSVVNVVHPGPCVGGNTDLQPKLIDLLLKAFSEAVPERAAAASGGSSSNFLFGGVHPVTKSYYTNYHFDGHGTGGTMLKDGNDGEITRHSNCRNTPIEVFEGRYPFRNLEYRLKQDSGGPGEHRGGLSTTRTLEVVADEITLSCLFDRAKIPGWGVFGGHAGGKSQLLVKRAGDDTFRTFVEAFHTVSPTKFTNVLLKRGDIVRYVTPGGGGYGNPLRRDPELVLADVRNGWVSPAAATRDYGVVIEERDDDFAIDAAATAELRAARSAA